MEETWLFDRYAKYWETKRGYVRLVVSGDNDGWRLVRLVLSPSTIYSWDVKGSLEEAFQFAEERYAQEFQLG